MAALQNFPILNQLADASEPNKAFDCVPTCLAACLQYLLGKPFDGGAIKDAVYGAGYVGGTEASEYVDYCQKQGVHLYAMNGEPASLISDVHNLLAQNIPTLITIPDPYMPANSGWTHVEAFHADSPGTLTALDPYGGKNITKSDEEWTGLLQDKQIWALERLVMLPQGWSYEGTTLHTPGADMVLGFAAYVKARLEAGTWEADDYPDKPQYYAPRLEASNPDLGDGDQIVTKKHLLGYPHNPTGAVAHLKNTVVEEFAGTELDYTRTQYTAIYAAYQALKVQQPQAPDPRIADYGNRLGQIHTISSI